jgi:hypothetical protein
MAPAPPPAPPHRQRGSGSATSTPAHSGHTAQDLGDNADQSEYEDIRRYRTANQQFHGISHRAEIGPDVDREQQVAEDGTRPATGQEPETGDRDRAERSGRLSIREPEKERQQPAPHQGEGTARRNLSRRGGRAQRDGGILPPGKRETSPQRQGKHARPAVRRSSAPRHPRPLQDGQGCAGAGERGPAGLGWISIGVGISSVALLGSLLSSRVISTPRIRPQHWVSSVRSPT